MQTFLIVSGIIAAIVLICIAIYYADKQAGKEAQRLAYEDIEAMIMLSSSEIDLRSNILFSSMEIFRRDFMYDETGTNYWIKMNKLKDDADKYYRSLFEIKQPALN